MAIEPVAKAEIVKRHRPTVQGKCPACHCNLLFLGDGGYVTCSKADCPDPEAATRMLENGQASTDEHMAVLLEAHHVFERRNKRYKDTWKTYGWRGCLVHLRTCVERAWVEWWDTKPPIEPRVDNLIDSINYAAFTIRNIRSNNRDGAWW